MEYELIAYFYPFS